MVDETLGGRVYVSFSGGKDSTVLLDLVRQEFPEVPAVFVDTGLEFPEIRNFVKLFENVEWVKPKKNFKQVVLEYGYPMISKEVSQNVWEVRTYGKERSRATYDKFLPDSDYNKKYGGQFSCEKYAFLLEDDAPLLSHKCCNVMKKTPAKEYEKRTGRKSFTAIMAEESRLRKASWLAHGCNAYQGKRPTSQPMAFWMKQDVLKYLKLNHDRMLKDLRERNPNAQIEHPWASVYGDIVVDGEVDGQIDLADLFGEGSLSAGKLKTTQQKRTGCMFCGFGCSQKGWDNLTRMKRTHPKQYEYIMKPVKDGGLGFKQVIDYINQKGGMNIRY